MTTWTIKLRGCDDNTYFDMELSDNDLDTLRRVSELSKQHSKETCMPTLHLEESK